METVIKNVIKDGHTHYYCTLCNIDFGRPSYTGVWLTGRSDLSDHVLYFHQTVDNTIDVVNKKSRYSRACFKCKKCDAEMTDVYSAITHKRLCGKYNINGGFTNCDWSAYVHDTTCLKCGFKIRQPYSVIGIQTDRMQLTYDMFEHLFVHECEEKVKTRMAMFHLLTHNMDVDQFSAKDIVQKAYPIGKFKVDW
jgi:hypothetical protein